MMDRRLDKVPLPRIVCCQPRPGLGPSRDYCTSFQYSCFTSHASQVNTSRNSTTHTPSARRAVWVGLTDVVEEIDRVAHEPVVLRGAHASGRDALEVVEHLLGAALGAGCAWRKTAHLQPLELREHVPAWRSSAAADCWRPSGASGRRRRSSGTGRGSRCLAGARHERQIRRRLAEPGRRIGGRHAGRGCSRPACRRAAAGPSPAARAGSPDPRPRRD